MLGSGQPTPEEREQIKELRMISSVERAFSEQKSREHGTILLILLGRGLWWFVAALILVNFILPSITSWLQIIYNH